MGAGDILGNVQAHESKGLGISPDSGTKPAGDYSFTQQICIEHFLCARYGARAGDLAVNSRCDPALVQPPWWWQEMVNKHGDRWIPSGGEGSEQDRVMGTSWRRLSGRWDKCKGPEARTG